MRQCMAILSSSIWTQQWQQVKGAGKKAHIKGQEMDVFQKHKSLKKETEESRQTKVQRNQRTKGFTGSLRKVLKTRIFLFNYKQVKKIKISLEREEKMHTKKEDPEERKHPEDQKHQALCSREETLHP